MVSTKTVELESQEPTTPKPKKCWRRWMPQSLFARFLLIIITPMVLMQLIATYVFYERHWDSVSRHMATSVAGDIAMVVKSIWRKESQEQTDILNVINNTMYLEARVFNEHQLKDYEEREHQREFAKLEQELRNKLTLAYQIEYLNEGDDVGVYVQLASGVLRVVFSYKRLANPSTYIFILWMMGASLMLVAVAVVFMKNQVRSISKLAEVAEAFGKGMELENFKPTGAKEVRMAGQAFLDMKERITKQMSQRLEMLAGVSHDLKTPLTRVKLQLAMMKPSKDIKELQADIDDMESMVAEYLNFAKGQDREPPQNVNIGDLIRNIAAKYREKHSNIHLKIPSGLVVKLSQQTIKRAFTNLIDNALRYAENVTVSGEAADDHVTLYFDDDGPGIPAKKREQVFKAFYRLEKSRNTATGGVGLGLTITKDAIIGHAGDIALSDSPEGGLRVTVTLPL